MAAAVFGVQANSCLRTAFTASRGLAVRPSFCRRTAPRQKAPPCIFTVVDRTDLRSQQPPRADVYQARPRAL